jgi:hypothetical protein
VVVVVVAVEVVVEVVSGKNNVVVVGLVDVVDVGVVVSSMWPSCTTTTVKSVYMHEWRYL